MRDIWVGKKGYKAFCKQDDDSYYDYHGNEKALTGITGNQNKFEIKRIIVIQFQ